MITRILSLRSGRQLTHFRGAITYVLKFRSESLVKVTPKPLPLLILLQCIRSIRTVPVGKSLAS